MKNPKVCVVTGSRAEYGLLRPLMLALKSSRSFDLQLIATGMHLSPEFGLTYRQIEEDGFRIDEKVEMLLSSDTPVGIAKSIGLGVIGSADALQRLTPDLLVLLGDRFEIMAAALAATPARIPIAHIHGGERTEGAMDEAIRHAITKMSHLHFTSTEEYRRRVIQLGEHPERVYNVGAIGIDNIQCLKLIGKRELEKSLGISFMKRNVLVTFHPVTLEKSSAGRQFGNLLRALDGLDETGIIFTKPNADTDGRIISRMIDDYVARNPEKTNAFSSLGSVRYLSLLRHVDAVVGNSSSALIEAPSFKVATVDIGDRQAGRIRADSVIHCATVTRSIKRALSRAFSDEFKRSIRSAHNPYGDGGTTRKIVSILGALDFTTLSVRKTFHDLSAGENRP